MAFGIGINTEHTEQEPLSGTYHEVAVLVHSYRKISAIDAEGKRGG